MLKYCVFPTSWGWVGVVAGERGVRRVELPRHSREEILGALRPSLEPGAREDGATLAPVRQRLEDYFRGVPVDFPFAVDLDGIPPFQAGVLGVVRQIPWGEVRSYRRVAEAAGNPRAARAVGSAMARNPIPVIIPCHRVVGSDGSLVGFGGGLELKRRLLELEGGAYR